jgi:hypothetical protein
VHTDQCTHKQWTYANRFHKSIICIVIGTTDYMIEVDIEDRAFTGAKRDQRTQGPVDMMRHSTRAKSKLTDKKQFLKFIMEF